ncbi:response regulator [Halovenus rubra]|uniref:Response regulator n=2 Tax=Halovenus rubra TaxID=869890 RepID=A0ACC7DYN5_9EURY|nr:response regulator [Halovenus rubra]
MSSNTRVLIVEDQEDVAQVYANILETEYEVLTAHSGEKAVELIDDTADILLLDRRLPGMSGDEVLEEINKNELGCKVVMVTAVEPDVEIVEMDFDEYLVKPVREEKITEVVEKMLARKEHDVQLQEMFALAEKLATLEAKLDIEQLNNSEEYQELRNEFATLQESVAIPESDSDPYLDATREKIRALLATRE